MEHPFVLSLELILTLKVEFLRRAYDAWMSAAAFLVDKLRARHREFDRFRWGESGGAGGANMVDLGRKD